MSENEFQRSPPSLTEWEMAIDALEKMIDALEKMRIVVVSLLERVREIENKINQ